jgi:hypothetical protein
LPSALLSLNQGLSDPIHIPRVREVEDYALNQQAAAPFGPMISGDIAAAPYIRHKELLPGMYEEHEVPEYDADDKDMAWLHNVNTKVSCSSSSSSNATTSTECKAACPCQWWRCSVSSVQHNGWTFLL